MRQIFNVRLSFTLGSTLYVPFSQVFSTVDIWYLTPRLPFLTWTVFGLIMLNLLISLFDFHIIIFVLVSDRVW